MKIRIVGTVLCFNFEEEKFDKISAICSKSGNKIKAVEKTDFDKPIGNMLGFDLPSDGLDSYDFDDELMLLYNFQSGDLNSFLRTLRSNELDVPLKAMLTETNKGWYPVELCGQIKKEHEQMTKGANNE